MFQIIDNIEVPVIASTRNRTRGPLATALDSLEVGQGFVFDDARPLKTVYPSVSPKRFPAVEAGFNKKFKIWQAEEGKVGVKRLADVAAKAEGETADTAEDEGEFDEAVEVNEAE